MDMDVTGVWTWILTFYIDDPRSLTLFQVSEDRLVAHHPSELPKPLASLLPPDPANDVADLLFDVFPARCSLVNCPTR